ncbi:SDR family oxidoreductase [Candidatus Bathyarchaeota archaeon]|nr:MAG: SDR family oxidoreductase [Candidatus Bathyarchaeota archaeon]
MMGRITGQTCLVTGGTRGIGWSAALQLAAQGGHVVLTCRDLEQGQRAVNNIQERLYGIMDRAGSINKLQADFRSLDSVRHLAQDFKQEYGRLDILVNNAGVLRTKRYLTKDGYEETFQVNHLAPFLLTNQLLPLLKKSAPSRIVNLASDAHNGARIYFDDLNGEKKYGGLRAYGQSKLANVLFTYELSRRLRGTSVTANALHPGAVASHLGEGEPGLFPKVFRTLKLFYTNPGTAAQSVTYLCTSAEVEGVTGKYYVKMNEAKSSRCSYDEAAAHRLWQVSEELTGLRETSYQSIPA